MTANHGANPFRLDGSRALVTGASRGIGAAIAKQFAQAGADLALCARTTEALQPVREDVSAITQRVFLAPGEFSDPSNAERVVDQAADMLGGLDIVVHCAGVVPSTPHGDPKIAPIGQSTPEEWSQVTSVNLDATVSLCRRSHEYLAASSQASLILISSVSGLAATPNIEAYGVTKAAQLSLTRSLAVAWAREGIRVNAIAPGWVRTDMTSFATGSGPVSDWLMAHVPQGRWIEPEEVAHGAVYLASPAASSVTGHTLVLDGGLSIPEIGLGGTPKPPSPFATGASA